MHDALEDPRLKASTLRVAADVAQAMRRHHAAIHPTHMPAGRATERVPNAAHSFVKEQLYDIRRSSSSSSSMTAMIVIIVGVHEKRQRVSIDRDVAPQSRVRNVSGGRQGKS